MQQKKYFAKILGLFFCTVCICGFLAQPLYAVADDEKELTEEEKQEKEREEEKKKKEIKEKKEKYHDKKEKYEEKLKNVEQKKAGLQKNLHSVNQSLNNTKRTINSVATDIEKKDQEISRHNKQIASLEDQTMLYKKSLAETMRKFYFAQNNRSLASVVDDTSSQRFLDSVDGLTHLRMQVTDAVDKLEVAKAAQEEEKRKLATAKKEKEALLAQQQKIASGLLAESSAVQGEIYQAEVSMAELRSKIANVENKLSSLLGKSYDTDDIVEAAKFASKKTGVRKSFILGMLVVETNLGRYTGGCTYKQSKMGSANSKVFKRICKDLDYDYKKKKVSCAASYGIGGAMGVAQFMPTTWTGYESRIEKYTGHSPADPWSLTDGVMAMAIKLSNDGASHKKGEYDAARRYYCGSRLDRSVCKNYANKVLYWAENYKDRL